MPLLKPSRNSSERRANWPASFTDRSSRCRSDRIPGAGSPLRGSVGEEIHRPAARSKASRSLKNAGPGRPRHCLRSCVKSAHAENQDRLHPPVPGRRGATQLPTAPLREALTEAGFENVATYINSGNAVLRSGFTREQVIANVAKICEDKFSFTKPIYAPTLAEWETLIANNPFPKFRSWETSARRGPRWRPHQGSGGGVANPYCSKVRRSRSVGKVAYLHTPNGFGTSKLAEKFDKGIGVANTARNWNTVVKLLELVRKAAG